MAITTAERTSILKLVVAMFNAPAGATYLSELTNAYETNGRSLSALAVTLSNTGAYKALNPNFQSPQEFAAKFLTPYGLQSNAIAVDFIVSKFNAGVNKGVIALDAATAINNYTGSDAGILAAKAIQNNKAAVAEYYSVTVGIPQTDLAALKAVFSGVTDASASVVAANKAIDVAVAAPTAFSLTTGFDSLLGTAAADTFKANVSQNNLGAQVNTLGSGDQINGGSGTDTLSAKITAGAYINGNGSVNFATGQQFTMPIEPETKSVEIVKFQAVESTIIGSVNPPLGLEATRNANTQVYVNAKDMEGVTQIGSSRSDADLTILNLTTKGLPSLLGQTLGMEYTGNADSRWGASDLTVYYDQDYLNAGTSLTSAIEIRVVNNLELAVNNRGLVAFERLSFRVGDQEVIVDITPAISALQGPAAYNALVAAIQAQLAFQGITDVTVTTLPTRTAVFTDDLGGFLQGAVAGSYTPIVVTSTALPLTRGLTQVDNTTLNFNGLNTQLFASETKDLLVTVNVALEKVGLAGDGGTFIAGSMNKTEANTWNAKNTVVDSTTSGIEKFIVSVGGDNTKSSSLAGMHSTNNNLKVVNVDSAANTLVGATFGNLTIGNSNTEGFSTDVQYGGRSYVVDRPDAGNQFALKDVQTFNAAGLKGNLYLTAALTQEVTAKYLNVVDNAANPAADNVAFTYTSGAGNDYINMYLDPANFEQPGTVTREDMSLTISTGLGNDEVLVGTGVYDFFQGEAGSGSTGPNWYENQHINANLKMVGGVATGQLLINTGAGSDIVRTLGSGDYAINLGADNDTAYLDNTGIDTGIVPLGRANWTINDLNNDANDLLSRPAAATATKIANLSLNVSFKGFEAKAFVGGSNNSLTGVSVNDLTINQAIKAAINLDPVLNKLLIAEDGPGRTLVITSLIDGRQQDGNAFSDVKLSLSTTALTTSQSAAFALSPAQATALGFGVATTSGFGATPSGRFDANLDDAGSPSTAISDNLVVGGLGNDVLVLGTGANSNDTVGYSGFGNGTDSIVNFDTTFIPAGAIVFNGGTKEVVNLVFSVSDGSPTSETIIFDGVTVVLAAPTLTGVIPAADVATQFTNQYNAAAASNGWVAVYTSAGNVTLTRDIPGNVTDLTPADFTGTYFGAANGNGTVTTAVTQGTDVAVPATSSTYTVTYTTATTAVATTTLSSVTGEAVGDGAFTLIGKAQGTPPAGFTAGPVVAAADGSSYTVKFTATVTGAVVLPTDASYGVDAASTADGVNGTYVGTLGTVATTTTPVGTVSSAAMSGPGLDMLDFTSYGVKAVFVGAGLVAGVAPVLGQTYIQMTESTTNAGEYTISQLTEAGAIDTVVGIVGIADFGATQPFIAANFVI